MTMDLILKVVVVVVAHKSGESLSKSSQKTKVCRRFSY